MTHSLYFSIAIETGTWQDSIQKWKKKKLKLNDDCCHCSQITLTCKARLTKATGDTCFLMLLFQMGTHLCRSEDRMESGVLTGNWESGGYLRGGPTSNPRWPTLITHSQGQESNEDGTPLEQLDWTTLFLGHAEPREGESGGRQRQ